jgi:hypothetical protein
LNSKTNLNTTAIAVLEALRRQDQAETEAAARKARNSGALLGSVGGTALVILGVVYKWVTGGNLPLN